MKFYSEITSEWDGKHYVIVSSKQYDYSGPIILLCGATGEQKSIEAKQSSFFDTMTKQASSVFGSASSVFNDLLNTFAPIVAAGPNQRGFSDQERATLNTQVTQGTADAYKHAQTAVNEQAAARGGGNEVIPSGADAQLRQEVASSAAAQEANQKLGVTQADFATGRENYFRAASGLAGATNVFNPAVGFDNSATGAGNAAANTANEIAQADNSWVSAVTGMVGGIAGAAVTGGMSNLGKGAGFFGGNAPAPGH